MFSMGYFVQNEQPFQSSLTLKNFMTKSTEIKHSLTTRKHENKRIVHQRND